MKSVLIIAVITFAFVYLSSGHEHTLSQNEEHHIADLIAKFPGHYHPKVDDDYVPRGRQYFVQELNMTVYDTAPNDAGAPDRVLISVYDIFGFHDHIKQIADTVAAGGPFRVVIPDFFRQGPVGSWENGVNQDVRDTVNYFRQSANNTFGIYGFCWGGRISVKAAQELGAIRGAGLIHPSGVVTDDALSLMGSALLLPANNDPDMDPFEAIVLDRLGLDSVTHRRFTDMTHGFAGAGGNWTVPLVNQRVDQVINYLVDFMGRHL